MNWVVRQARSELARAAIQTGSSDEVKITFTRRQAREHGFKTFRFLGKWYWSRSYLTSTGWWRTFPRGRFKSRELAEQAAFCHEVLSHLRGRD